MIENFIVVLSEDYVIASIISSVSLLLCMGCRRCISNVHSELFRGNKHIFRIFHVFYFILQCFATNILLSFTYHIFVLCIGYDLFCTFSSFAYFVLAF